MPYVQNGPKTALGGSGATCRSQPKGASSWQSAALKPTQAVEMKAFTGEVAKLSGRLETD